MQDVEINIEEPNILIDETSQQSEYVLPTATATRLGGIKVGENLTVESDGTLNAVQGSYTLPQATNNTLGGVYVDNTLSTSSENPVQNKLVSGSLNNLSSSLSTLESSISTLSGRVTTLSQSVEDLSTSISATDATVADLQDDVTANTSNIATNTSNITSLQSSVGTLNTTVSGLQTSITDLNNGFSQVQSSISSLLVDTNLTFGYGVIDLSVWTGGNIKVMAKGMNGYIQVDLAGNLTLPAGGSFAIYNVVEVPIKYTMINLCSTNAGTAILRIKDDGDIEIVNNTSNSMSITEIKGIVPFIINASS